APLFRIGAQVLEGLVAQCLPSGRNAGLDAIQELRKGQSVVVAAPKDQGRADRARNSRAHELRQRAVDEGPRPDLAKHALPGEEAQGTIERVFVDMKRRGKIRAVTLGLLEQISDPQLSCCTQRLMHD